jgi:hypothetical protein
LPPANAFAPGGEKKEEGADGSAIAANCHEFTTTFVVICQVRTFRTKYNLVCCQAMVA